MPNWSQDDVSANLSTLAAKLANAIIMAEKLGQVPHGLSYKLSPDGCKVLREGELTPDGKWERWGPSVKSIKVWQNF